ncbi:hypothetical protein ACM26V_18780 [Salipaludibacillus sp. HK11]
MNFNRFIFILFVLLAECSKKNNGNEVEVLALENNLENNEIN